MCESAIEAFICYQLLGGCVCISTDGARSDARWLPTLPGHGYEVHNGFDDGERQSSKARPTVQVRCNEPIPVASGATTDQVVELMPAGRTLVGMSRTLKNLGIEIPPEENTPLVRRLVEVIEKLAAEVD